VIVEKQGSDRRKGNGMETNGPRKLVELAEYGEGSIVSRTIIDKEAGNVTLFAFDEGQGLSEHTAPYDALVHLVEGTAEVTIGDSTYRLGAGDVLVMPAGIPHSLKALERFKMVLVMIRS